MKQDKKNIYKRKGKDTTLKKISERTGFACSTVSAVLNNDSKCYASIETKEKILKAAKELNYHPNLLYRGLRTKKTNTLGLIVPNLHVNISVANIELLERLAWESGYHLFIGYSQNNIKKEEALLKDFISRRVDGIILVVGAEKKSRPELRYLIEQNFPLITIGELVYFNCPFVSTDYYKGGQLAAQHLNDLGHKEVLLFDLFLHSTKKSLRMEGFRNLAKKYNMKIDEVFLVEEKLEIQPILSEEYTITKSLAIFKKILKNHRPTSIFASNDEMALGVIKAAQELNIRVPEELAVIGFDDTPISAFASIPITTIRQRKEEISKKVFKFLIDKIELAEEKPVKEYVVPELVIRASTCSVGKIR